MAAPANLRDLRTPGRDPVSQRLSTHVVRLLVAHLAATAGRAAGWRLGPLVIISAADAAASAVIEEGMAAGGQAAAHDVIVRSGRDLDRDIAAALAGERLGRLGDVLSAGRLVVVDRIDGVRGSAHRQALVRLIDASTKAGTTWCVSVPRLEDAELGGPLASRLAGGMVVATPPPPTPAPAGAMPSLARIVRAAARLHDVSVAALSGPGRSRPVAAARCLAMHLARRLTGSSFRTIGAALGGRDHTTILHGVRVCEGRIAADHGYAADVERLAAALTTAKTPGNDADGGRPGVGSSALRRALTSRHWPRRRRA
jgi:hypothetical protein